MTTEQGNNARTTIILYIRGKISKHYNADELFKIKSFN